MQWVVSQFIQRLVYGLEILWSTGHTNMFEFGNVLRNQDIRISWFWMFRETHLCCFSKSLLFHENGHCEISRFRRIISSLFYSLNQQCYVSLSMFVNRIQTPTSQTEWRECCLSVTVTTALGEAKPVNTHPTARAEVPQHPVYTQNRKHDLVLFLGSLLQTQSHLISERPTVCLPCRPGMRTTVSSLSCRGASLDNHASRVALTAQIQVPTYMCWRLRWDCDTVWTENMLHGGSNVFRIVSNDHERSSMKVSACLCICWRSTQNKQEQGRHDRAEPLGAPLRLWRWKFPQRENNDQHGVDHYSGRNLGSESDKLFQRGKPYYGCQGLR